MRSDNLVIGIGGWDRAGKDTVAHILAAQLKEATGTEVEVIGMSDVLRDIIFLMDPWLVFRQGEDTDVKVLKYRAVLEALKDTGLTSDEAYEQAKEIEDVRDFLRTMGNRVGRELISPTLWPDLAAVRINWIHERENHHAIITGVRHQSDLDMVHGYSSGLSIHVHRPGTEPTDVEPENGGLKPTQFKFGVNNAGTVEDLETKNIPALVQVIKLELDRRIGETIES